MQHVRIRISAGGDASAIHPMYGVLAESAIVERATAEQWNFTGDALGILHYVEGDVDALERAMDDIAVVVGYDVERLDERSAYVYVRDATTEPARAMFGALAASGVVVVPPIEYHADGTVSLSAFGPDDELQAAIDEFDAPVDLTIEAVGGLAGATASAQTLLTDRQREVVRTALDLGYYDVPRTASQADIATALDAATGTVAEHLRKAEATVLRVQFDVGN